MNETFVFLAVIPARRDSRGVPAKNKRLLAERPLMQYTAAAARAAGLTDVLVSTNDPEIAAWARREGLTVLGLRPDELARDETPIKPVLQHELTRWEGQSGRRADAVVLLQPTSPLRSKDDIETGLVLFRRHPECDSVVSVVRVPHRYSPRKLLVKDKDGRLRPWLEGDWPHEGSLREAEPTLWARNGPAVLITRRSTLMEKNSLYGEIVLGFEMPGLRSVDIDDENDWTLVETLIQRRRSV